MVDRAREQHHGVVRGLATTDRTDLRERHLDAAMRGRTRCGVAFAGAIPAPPRLWATPVDGGHRLDGTAPLVTGWGLVDLLQVSARVADPAQPVGRAENQADDEARIVALLVGLGRAATPAAVPASDGVTVHPLDLAAADGSRTVRLAVDGWFVADDAVVATTTRAQFLAGMTFSARVNGCLTLVAAGRPEIRSELLTRLAQ